MVNYNQKYKNQVICAIRDTDSNNFDSSIDSSAWFNAAGKQTSDSLYSIKDVSQLVLFSTKPDSFLNFDDSNTVKIYDDARTLATMDTTSAKSLKQTYCLVPTNSVVHFDTSDKNVTFDSFSPSGNMVKDVSTLVSSGVVSNFNATITVPSDVKCNYATGLHQFINHQTVNLLFDGNIKKGDTITIKRYNRVDHTSTMQFDTDLVFGALSMDGSLSLEIIYNHVATTTPVPATPVNKKYELDPILQNATVVDPQPVNETSGKTYYLDPQHTTVTIKANEGYIFETDGTLTYETDDHGGYSYVPVKATHTDTVTVSLPSNINWSYQSLFVLKINATLRPDLQPKPVYKGELIPRLENAKLIEPKPVVDSSGTTYYLDPDHRTVTIKANAGYTFETDGTITYPANGFGSLATFVIPATHTDTVTATLPSNIDWPDQNVFTLTMVAVASKIVENTGGFVNIYKADYASLLKFSSEIISKITGTGIDVLNAKPYINNLVMIPFNVPSGANSAIVAGNNTFQTELPTVENNYLTVDLGKITVSEQYQNAYDYYRVNTKLVLPYTSPVDLEPKHVIDKTVSIKYVVNIINGDTTINLYNDDELFFSQQVNLASEIPFISNATSNSQYVVINQLKTMFRNEINQAYIIIEQPTPILNLDYYPTNETGTLKGYQGNVKASLLNNMNVNSDDLNDLQNLLKSGVKIK